LHDALPISPLDGGAARTMCTRDGRRRERTCEFGGVGTDIGGWWCDRGNLVQGLAVAAGRRYGGGLSFWLSGCRERTRVGSCVACRRLEALRKVPSNAVEKWSAAVREGAA